MPKVAACIAVVGVLAVSACSGPGAEVAASQPPTASATESATPTPTVTPPPMPPEASERTTAGAEAFTRHYFDMANYAFATGDTGGLESLSMSECTSCESTIAYIREPVNAGGRWHGSALLVRDIAAAPLEEPGAIVTVLLEQSAGSIEDLRGDSTQVPSVPKYTGNIYLTWSKDRWTVYGLAHAD